MSDIRNKLVRHHAVTLVGAIVIVVVSFAASYGLARWGEPQAAWAWCTIGRMC